MAIEDSTAITDSGTTIADTAVISGVEDTKTADTTGAAVASTGVAMGTRVITAAGAIIGVVADTTVKADTTGVEEGITAVVGTMAAEITTEAVDIMVGEDITGTDGTGSVNLLRDQAS
jgi:hypothetical protein